MPTCTLLPRATRTCAWGAFPTTTELQRHTLIDEGVDTPDETDYITYSLNAGNAHFYMYDATHTTPDDVLSVTAIRVRFRFKCWDTGTAAMTIGLYLTQGDSSALFYVGVTLELLKDNTIKTGYYEFNQAGFPAKFPMTKAQADKLEVRFRSVMPGGAPGQYPYPEIEE